MKAHLETLLSSSQEDFYKIVFGTNGYIYNTAGDCTFRNITAGTYSIVPFRVEVAFTPASSAIAPRRIGVQPSDGTYSFTGVAPGSYTVAVHKTGATFASNSSSVPVNSDVAGLDFQAVKTKFSITVHTGISPTKVSLMSGTVLRAYGYTNTAGDFTFNNISAGTYTVVPLKTGVTYTPTKIPVTIANGTTTNPSPANAIVSFAHTP